MDENMELPFENEIRLTELADSCGCAAKLEPRLLAGVLEAGVLQAARLSDRVAAPSRAAARLVRFFMLVSTP